MSRRTTIDGFRSETRGFMSHSLYDPHWFGVSGGLWEKVNADGAILPFYGNTMIFELEDDDKKWLAEIQRKLYDAADAWAERSGRWRFLAEPLREHTFHITLHDLLHSPSYDTVADAARAMAPAAEGRLAEIRAKYPDTVYMRPVFLFNMMNTSVVLGFEPCSDADCETLMALYDEFQGAEFCPLGHELTPHVTMAYYRPDEQGYDADMVSALGAVFAEVNHTLGRRVVKLKMSNLKHSYFIDMNHYTDELTCIG